MSKSKKNKKRPKTYSLTPATISAVGKRASSEGRSDSAMAEILLKAGLEAGK